MGKQLIKKYVEARKNSSFGTMDAWRAEANLGLQLECLISAWASLSSECKNKNDWNNFAKYVLSEVESIDKIIKEVNK